jgi:lipopolysaccharide transport system permease protein
MAELDEYADVRIVAPKSRPVAGTQLSGSVWFDWLLVVWRNRAFTAALVRRDVAVRYRGSALGMAWLVGIPLAMMATYLTVFAGMFSVRFGDGGLARTAFAIWAGTLGWQILSEAVGRSATILFDNMPYVKRIPFPLAILPVMPLLTACIGGAVSLALFIAAYVAVFREIPVTWLLAPAAFAPLLLIGAGTAWIVAGLGTFVRDLKHVVPLSMSLLLFLTPVLYPLSAAPPKIAAYVSLNPLGPVFETMRQVMVFGTAPPVSAMALHAGLATLYAIAGYAIFRSREWEYADVV